MVGVDWEKKVIRDAKRDSSGPKEFLRNIIRSGIPVTYPEVFLDIYYYERSKSRKKKENNQDDC